MFKKGLLFVLLITKNAKKSIFKSFKADLDFLTNFSKIVTNTESISKINKNFFLLKKWSFKYLKL